MFWRSYSRVMSAWEFDIGSVFCCLFLFLGLGIFSRVLGCVVMLIFFLYFRTCMWVYRCVGHVCTCEHLCVEAGGQSEVSSL